MNFVRWHTQSFDSSSNDTPSTREGDAAASGYTSEDVIESQDTDGEGDEKESSSDEGEDDKAEDDSFTTTKEKKGDKTSSGTEFQCWDQNTSTHVKWDYTEEWENITAKQILFWNMPNGEVALWVRLTNKKLRANNKAETGIIEMNMFLGCLFAVTQEPRKGEVPNGVEEDKLDYYWDADQYVGHFNEHYKVNFKHGWKVTVDEYIFWGFARNQPGGEYKCLSAVGLNAATTFEHVCGKKHNNERKYTKECGAGAAVVLQLCEAARIQGTNRVVIADSCFGGMRLPKGLMTIGLQNISNIKSSSTGFCKKELQEKLMGDDVERGAHAIATITIDGLKLTALAYREKSNCHRKSKAKKSNFYSYYIATDCCTTLPGKPAEKRYCPDGSRAPSKLIPWCNMVEEYYAGMPVSDIVNGNAQFVLGIGEVIRTTDIKICIACSAVGT
eukprot:13003018-Ditylum_brightwellii.AAC.1